MEFMNSLKKNVMVFILALPLLLIGYEAFMTLSTSNLAWGFLLVGQMVLVPVAYYLLSTAFYLSNHLSKYFAAMLFLILSVVPIILFSTLRQ